MRARSHDAMNASQRTHTWQMRPTFSEKRSIALDACVPTFEMCGRSSCSSCARGTEFYFRGITHCRRLSESTHIYMSECAKIVAVVPVFFWAPSHEDKVFVVFCVDMTYNYCLFAHIQLVT